MCLSYVVAVHVDRKGGPPFYTAYLEGLGEKQVEGQRLFPVASQDEQPPPVSAPVPSQYYFRESQARKDKKEKNKYLKQMSELAKIVQQQRLENKKLEKLFSDYKRHALQPSVDLSQQQESSPADPWEKFVSSEVTGYYYAVARGRIFDSFGIYADVNKLLFEVNGVVGSLFKVCESYSEARLYVKELFTKEDPTPLDVAATDSPPSFPEGGSSSPPVPPGGEKK
jgi:hypothetical protein